MENPRQVIRSWNLQSNFQTGNVVKDNLVPPVYGRIRTPFIQTWREEALSQSLDWGSKSFSVFLPESLRVVSAIYLKIVLPANNAANYKAYPGLYAIDNIRIVSAGQEVYTVNYADFMTDYCQSLSNEELAHFREVYLGHTGGSVSGATRTILLPIMLPNSAYLHRNGHDTRGHGVMPLFLGQNRCELQLTLNDATFTSTDTSNPTPTIAGACALMYHEVQMTDSKIQKYCDQRGKYSIITRRFTEITNGWQHYSSANSIASWSINQPQGVVTEVMFIAVAHASDDAQRSRREYILPTSLKVTADSIVQKNLDTPEKVKCDLWVNGFKPNTEFPGCGRLCFANHCAEGSTHMYTGGYSMGLSSTITFEYSFGSACDVRIVAIQLQRVKINALGVMRAYLE